MKETNKPSFKTAIQRCLDVSFYTDLFYIQEKQEPASYTAAHREQEKTVWSLSVLFWAGGTEDVRDLLQTDGNSVLIWKHKVNPVKQRFTVKYILKRVYTTQIHTIFLYSKIK